MLWDAGLSADPASRDDGNPFGRSTSPSPCLDDRPKRTSHFSNQGLDDDNGSSNLEAPPDGGTPFSAAEDVAFPAASQAIDDVLRVRPSGAVGYLKEMDQALAHRRAAGATSAGEAVAEEQAEWTMGRMLRVALWTDPSLCECACRQGPPRFEASITDPSPPRPDLAQSAGATRTATGRTSEHGRSSARQLPRSIRPAPPSPPSVPSTLPGSLIPPLRSSVHEDAPLYSKRPSGDSCTTLRPAPCAWRWPRRRPRAGS